MQELAGEVIGRGVGEKRRLIERFRETIRARHYSRRTEGAYWYWVRFFIFSSVSRPEMVA